MRISAKGRYGLSSMIYLTLNTTTEYVTVLKISEDLGISKIYLEQVFSLLKRAALVNSIKGSSGGYQLSRSPEKITAFDILNAFEVSLFEATEKTSSKKSSYIDNTLSNVIWNSLDNNIKQFLKSITLSNLSAEASKNQKGNDYMYFI